MKNKNTLRGILFFLAGALAASALLLGVVNDKPARADQYSCIRTDLNARGMSGNIPDPQFVITYQIPTCYAAAGYKATEAFMRSGEVAVRYKKE